MVKATLLSVAKSASFSSSLTEIAMFSTLFSKAVPGLPGATNTLLILSDCAVFQARACSLPPLLKALS